MPLVMAKTTEMGHHLDGFPKSHLIGQQTSMTVLPMLLKPLHTFKLIGVERCMKFLR